MIRRAVVLTLSGLAVLAAASSVVGFAPAASAADAPVVSGTFTGALTMSDTWVKGGWGAQSGPRTFGFGAGCAVTSACTTSRENGSTTAMSPGSGGTLRWSGTEPVGCYSIETGELRTKHGFDYTYDAVLTPSSTTVVDGTTYVTAFTGTYVGTLAVNATGRRFDCLVTPRRVPKETERGTYSLRLAPLAAPKPIAETAPLAVAPTGASGGEGPAVAAATMAGFTLPQTDRQARSAAAVAAGTRSSVPGALVTPSEATRSAASTLPRDLLWVALLGLLLVFPAQLFNATYEENHERVDRQLARLRLRRRRDGPRDAPSRGRRLLVFGGCVLVGGLLGGLLDPGFGADRASAALLVGVLLSVLVTVLVVALTGRWFRTASHHEHGWYLRAIPSALLVAVVCVLVSRLTHFEPGYLYGVLGGAIFAVALDQRSEGRVEVAVTVVVLLLALAAWLAFGSVAEAASGSDPSVPVLAADAFLGSLFIGGIEGLVFGLVPLKFLPGARITGWSWVVWVLVAVPVLYLFVHVLLLPESGYLGRSTSASATVTLALFLAFGVVSVLFWGWFKLRPGVEDQPDPPAATIVDEPVAAS